MSSIAHGRYLLHPDPQRVLLICTAMRARVASERPRDALQILGQARRHAVFVARRPGLLQVYARIQPPGQYNVAWTLIDVQSLDTMLAELGRTRAVILSVAGVALLLAIIAAVVITGGIVRPARRACARGAARSTKARPSHAARVCAPRRGRHADAVVHADVGRVRSLLGALRQRVAELERSDAAQRAGEARLRQMVDTNLAGIAFADVRTGEVLEANDAFLRIVGYDREDLRAGRIARESSIRRSIASARGARSHEARERGACTPYEKEYVRKDGTRVPVLMGMAMVEGSLYEAVSFVLDQTAIKQAEADQKARLEAESANRAKSEFLARMSHELRTPLNAILGFAHIMRWDPGLNERSRAGLAAIQTSGEHLLQLIVDLLDLSRIEAGRFKLEPKPTDVERVLSPTCATSSACARNRSRSNSSPKSRAALPHTVVVRRVPAAPGAAEPARQRGEIHRPRRGAAAHDRAPIARPAP